MDTSYDCRQRKKTNKDIAALYVSGRSDLIASWNWHGFLHLLSIVHARQKLATSSGTKRNPTCWQFDKNFCSCNANLFRHMPHARGLSLTITDTMGAQDQTESTQTDIILPRLVIESCFSWLVHEWVMTRSCFSWLVHVFHDSFMNESWLIHVLHDSFMNESLAKMNESWMNHSKWSAHEQFRMSQWWKRCTILFIYNLKAIT